METVYTQITGSEKILHSILTRKSRYSPYPIEEPIRPVRPGKAWRPPIFFTSTTPTNLLTEIFSPNWVGQEKMYFPFCYMFQIRISLHQRPRGNTPRHRMIHTCATHAMVSWRQLGYQNPVMIPLKSYSRTIRQFSASALSRAPSSAENHFPFQSQLKRFSERR